jgi:heptosyltransferase-2
LGGPLKLAIRAPNWVGDLVMATPVLEAALADARFEEVRIVVREHLARVLEDGPCAPHLATVRSDKDEIALYRSLAPDALLLLSNSFGAAWRAFRAGVRLRAGSALSGRRWLLQRAFVPPTRGGRRIAIPTAHLLRDVAGLFGILVPDLHPHLVVRAELVREERARLERLGVDLARGYVLCCPGAAYGAAKLWPVEHIAAALDGLFERHGARAVVSGGPGEEALCDEVAQRTRHGAVSLAREERDLARLKALVRESRLLLVGDSGPRWYAAAFDVPCVSVMGPNDPRLTASSLEHARIVRRDDLECSPCMERVCPLGHHRCMRELEPERVLAAAGELLGKPR